jgi:ABC-type glycerol-3-phosphate transport system permease component
MELETLTRIKEELTTRLIAAIHTLLVYIFLGKYFIQGVLSGSILVVLKLLSQLVLKIHI